MFNLSQISSLPVRIAAVKPISPCFALGLSLFAALVGCGGLDEELGSTSSTSSSASDGPGGAGETSTGTGGAGFLASTVVEELRADTEGTLAKYATEEGWPLPVDGGYLFVSTNPGLPLCAGDHDQWSGTPMKPDRGFQWLVLPVFPGDQYKFTDKTTFQADPWARSYTYDMHGEISLVKPSVAHLDRWPMIEDTTLTARTLRVWVPKEPIQHELYVHDGQNLFDPNAPWGGWRLQESVPPGMLVVGIDNTPSRMDEYTHVPDAIGGKLLGGQGDAYADFLKNTVRPLIQKHYGEPGPVGVLGSSLGGLISFHIADRDPGDYAFAASLSGTMGWGSIGDGIHNQTMIERYQSHGHQGTVLYLDSGGSGMCFDSDGDGIQDDDPNAADNFCETAEMRDVLVSLGYEDRADFFYFWEKDAQHNEAAWAARVFRPLQFFDAL
jgi:hypothetical protein